MPWFQSLCRNMGLMVHHIKHPEKPESRREEVGRQQEEQRISPTTTLRRTTIEEIEIKHPQSEARHPS